MAVVVVLVLVAVAVILVARVLQRRRQDEIRSIHHYHDRLDTLHVDSHDRGGSVRVVQGEVQTALANAPDRPRLDPEAAHLDTAAPLRAPAEPRRRHDGSWAIERMEPRARVDTATILVVSIVIVVLVGLAFAGYLIQRGRGASPTTTTTTAPHVNVTAPPPMSPTSTATGVATYALPQGSYSVVVRADGGGISMTATSPITTGTPSHRSLAEGSSTSLTFHGTSSVTVAPPIDASVSVNGRHVKFPPQLGSTLTLRFSG